MTRGVKIIKHRLARHLEGPHRVSGAAPPTLELAGLVQVPDAGPRRELLLPEAGRAAENRRGGPSAHRLCPNGLRRTLTGQPGDLSIQSRDDRRQPLHPFCGPVIRRQPHLLGVLVAEEPLSQGAVEAFYNSLVPVAIDPAAPYLNAVLSKEFAN